jgi:hypothetical protein
VHDMSLSIDKITSEVDALASHVKTEYVCIGGHRMNKCLLVVSSGVTLRVGH